MLGLCERNSTVKRSGRLKPHLHHRFQIQNCFMEKFKSLNTIGATKIFFMSVWIWLEMTALL